MSAADRHLLVERLRDEIRRIEHRPGRRAGAVASGRAEIHRLLPDGGFPRGALTEIAVRREREDGHSARRARGAR